MPRRLRSLCLHTTPVAAPVAADAVYAITELGRGVLERFDLPSGGESADDDDRG